MTSRVFAKWYNKMGNFGVMSWPNYNDEKQVQLILDKADNANICQQWRGSKQEVAIYILAGISVAHIFKVTAADIWHLEITTLLINKEMMYDALQ